MLFEKEDRIASHQTGHNSGVIHSGIYYAPGSLKARLCVDGARQLRTFCKEHEIPYREIGKLIVATRETELPRLQELYRRGLANGVPRLELIGPDRIRQLEPNVQGLQAIHSPSTTIVDFSRVANALADDVTRNGGVIRTGTEVVGIKRHGLGWGITTAQESFEAATVITCGGLHSDRLATMTGAPKEPSIIPFRGQYWRLRQGRKDLIRSLIYPVPDPTFPFLGVHFTPRMNGEVWLGPNAVLALAREGYRWTTIRPAEAASVVAAAGFIPMARRYWRTGLIETYRTLNRWALLKELRRFTPDLRMEDIQSGSSGVRAQAVSPEGKLIDDFVFDGGDGVLHVRNAPSPAATASLSIAAEILDRSNVVASPRR